MPFLSMLIGPQGMKCWKRYQRDFEKQSEWFADMIVRTLLKAVVSLSRNNTNGAKNDYSFF
jgi:hypothetical protein